MRVIKVEHRTPAARSEAFERLNKSTAFRNGEKFRRALVRAGSRLREARLSAGLTQVEVAERSGISQADISRLEAGVSTNGPELGSILRYATACGCELYLELKTSSAIQKVKPRSLLANQSKLTVAR